MDTLAVENGIGARATIPSQASPFADRRTGIETLKTIAWGYVLVGGYKKRLSSKDMAELARQYLIAEGITWTPKPQSREALAMTVTEYQKGQLPMRGP